MINVIGYFILYTVHEVGCYVLLSSTIQISTVNQITEVYRVFFCKEKFFGAPQRGRKMRFILYSSYYKLGVKIFLKMPTRNPSLINMTDDCRI